MAFQVLFNAAPVAMVGTDQHVFGLGAATAKPSPVTPGSDTHVFGVATPPGPVQPAIPFDVHVFVVQVLTQIGGTPIPNKGLIWWRGHR